MWRKGHFIKVALSVVHLVSAATTRLSPQHNVSAAPARDTFRPSEGLILCQAIY